MTGLQLTDNTPKGDDFGKYQLMQAEGYNIPIVTCIGSTRWDSESAISDLVRLLDKTGPCIFNFGDSTYLSSETMRLMVNHKKRTRDVSIVCSADTNPYDTLLRTGLLQLPKDQRFKVYLSLEDALKGSNEVCRLPQPQ